MSSSNWAGPYGTITPRRRGLVWEVKYGNGNFTNLETNDDPQNMTEGEPFVVSMTIATRLRFTNGDTSQDTWLDVPPGVYSGRLPQQVDAGTPWKQIFCEDLAGSGQTGWATLVFPLRDQ